MYPVSDAFLRAVQENTRNYRWTGQITTKGGAVYPFVYEDIMKGSGYITAQCCGSAEIELGTVYAAEMGITLFSQIDRYTLEGAEVRLSYHLRLADGSFEEVPMGIFEVSEANRTVHCLELKAYDYMLRFEKSFNGFETVGNAYAFLDLCCKACAVELAHTQAEIEGILSLYYPIDGLVPNITNTFNVHLRMEGGTAVIDTGGCIDLIITKSVSRFARNTVDSLTTIRKLKEHRVECYFEKENIWTFDSKGELLLTIMSSLAQEESRSISENVTWGQRKRFADGKVTVPFKRFLGYDRGEDGNLVINEEQAAVVRRIYGMFLQGRSPFAIAKALTEEGIPTPGGKANWSGSTVRSILTNEKYKGDALLQKVYTVDFLSKKKKVNEGEIPQYYVEHNHEAIIEPSVFEAVQKQIAVRQTGTNRQSSVGIFSSKIKCGDCGSWYGSKVWHSNSKYRRVIWQCNHKFDGGEKCGTPHLDEETIKALFLKAVNILTTEKDEIAANFHAIKGRLFDTAELEAEQSRLQEELNVVAGLIQQCIDENAHVALDQTEYQARYDGLAERFDRTKARLDEVGNAITEKQAKREQIERFLAELERQDGVATGFDESLWYSQIDFVTVFNKEDVRFTFKDGTEIRV